MATEALISWHAPEHLYVEKKPDWYWTVGIITLALAAVSFIFGNIIVGIFVLVAATVLVLHASKPPRVIYHEINDRGIILDNALFSFTNLESFWVPHDGPAKLILKSRKTLMPLIVILIDEVDPEEVREVMLKYIVETEHSEPFLKGVLERFGF